MAVDQKDKKVYKPILDQNPEFTSEEAAQIFNLPEVAEKPLEAEESKEGEKTVEIIKPVIGEKKIEKQPTGGAISAVTAKPPTAEMIELQNIREIENLMAEGLGDIYKKMDPVSQRQFKIQGEDAARVINVLLAKTKVKIKEIVNALIKWLKLIPGVTNFFIEQQAKIKTDKIMAIKRKRDRSNLNNPR